jgi:predicted acylesterase/phospholipase RssA
LQPTGGVPHTLVFTDCVGVFQGGGCRAAAHAGAFAAARERGVHFHEVAGASAGAIVAVLIAAGAEPEWLNQQLQELDFGNFLGPPEGRAKYPISRILSSFAWGQFKQALDLVNYQGLHSGGAIEKWVEDRLQELIPGGTKPSITFSDLQMPAAVIAADLREGRSARYGTRSTPYHSVAAAVRASCSMPFFFQAVDGQVDGGVLSNLPAHLVGNEDGERSPILAFVLEDESGRNDPTNLTRFTTALAETIVRGAQELQTQLQSELHVIRINTGSIKATDFATITTRDVQQLRKAGYVELPNSSIAKTWPQRGLCRRLGLNMQLRL